jgi:hypothetical protein
MPKIVLSYRRSDAQEIAGRIHDRLAAHYGREAVFMDINTIPFGMEFRKHILDVLAETDLLLAIIGPQWAGEGERRRIDEQNDYVRLEIETALQRNILVIPVLVSRATMPSPNDLPESLANLASRNAITIDSGGDFHSQMGRLISSMDGHLAKVRHREEARQRAEQVRIAADDAALRWYRKAADLGQPRSMASLGFMYETGRGVTKDEAEAERWYRKAAESGDAWGMACLGFMYETGRGGVTKDEAKAVHWYCKAAHLGRHGQ